MKNQQALASRNIGLYVLLKIFAKRVFLPLSAIYFMDQAGFSFKEIGLLGAFYALVQLLAELPTGYFADKFARVASIRIGAALNIGATLLYVIYPTKLGVFSGMFLEAVGYCFMAGAGEALIHDSLVVKRRVADYSKVLSRAMSISLLINAGIVALVPMTYRIDPRLPFLIGTLAYSILLAVALLMGDVARERPVRAKAKIRHLQFRHLLQHRHIVVAGLLFGVVAALYSGPGDMITLALKDFGLNPEYLGWLFAAGSLVGAAIGVFVHVLKRLSIQKYMLIDSLIMLLPFGAAFTQSALLLGGAFIINMSFWRYRRIIYQNHLLELYPTNYKATLLSAMSNVEELNLLWVPLATALAVSHTSLPTGLGLMGLLSLAIVPCYLWAVSRLFAAHGRS